MVTYLRRLEVDRPLVTARAGMGIVSRGAEIYAGACAQCHGEHGQGATGSALANPDFLQAASDGFLQATIVLGRDGTAMRAMGKAGQGNVELSPDDVNNVVAFIRSWQRQPPDPSRRGATCLAPICSRAAVSTPAIAPAATASTAPMAGHRR